MAETIKISTLKIKFKEILELIDDAIEKRKKIKIPNESLKQKNNNILFLEWLHKHKIIELEPVMTKKLKRLSSRSRFMKIQIALQLKTLGCSENEIAKIFRVKLPTVKSYLKELASFNQKYLEILKIALDIKGVVKNSPLNEFPTFPIRVKINKIKERLNQTEFNELKFYIEKNKWIKMITGKDLGTQDLSILLPKN